jgi:ABC-type transport system involved in multi-copper enzyme maturation permease subunit
VNASPAFAPAPAPAPAPSPEDAGPPSRVLKQSLIERVLKDPNAIWLREMKQSARVGRTPWILFAITLAIALLMCSIGGIASASNTTPASIGSGLFQTFFSLAFLVVTLVGPAVAANSIASEREGKTWEAVLLTGLAPAQIARGKFMAAYTTIALYIVVLSPVGALPFLFGGVTAVDTIVAFAFLFLYAALAVAFGLAVSSLMSSLRGAIVVTLVLAILIGPILYGIFGSFASIGIHALWPEVPDGYPIWLPLAYSRARFGLEYVVFLVVLPILLIAIPAWFLYAVTISNLTGEADDRSTGIKVWFALCTPLLALACAVPSIAAADDSVRMGLGCAGMSFFALHLAFSAMLIAFEPLGPSRRVAIHWERSRTGALKRFFGPGLSKGALLVAMIGAFAIIAIGVLDIGALQLFGSPPKKDIHTQQLFFFMTYTVAFFLFLVGLVAIMRSRGNTPWIARIIAAGIVLLILAGPWIIAAIGGVFAHKDGWVVAAPSPFYVFYMIAEADKISHSDMPIIEVGLIATVFWAALGLLLLSLAARKASVVVAQHEAAVAQVEAALKAELENRDAAA